MRWWSLNLGLLFIFVSSAFGQTELCLYHDDKGNSVQVNGKEKVPEQKRDQARCFQTKETVKKEKSYPIVRPQATPKDPGMNAVGWALPSEVSLDGNIRTADIASSLGRIRLRWPRTVEQMFGRTPERAMVDAARTASRALKAGAFPTRLQSLHTDWEVVFIEKDPPAGQVPGMVRTSCHPAWMVPPAYLYVVAERVVAGCGGGQRAATTVADAQLSQILVHEIGHAIEFQLLEQKSKADPVRAEGFATWFEEYAAQYSSLVSASEVSRKNREMAKIALREKKGKEFSYTAEDYALASMYFNALVNRRGIAGLVDVYHLMTTNNLPFLTALMKGAGWNERQLGDEILRLLK